MKTKFKIKVLIIFLILLSTNIKAETICIHGDQNNAVDFAKNISIELSKIGHYEKKF